MKPGDPIKVKHDISLNGGGRVLPAGTRARVLDVVLSDPDAAVEVELDPDDGGVYWLNINDVESDPR